jgi:putative membrane protein (TIGR04086 family)
MKASVARTRVATRPSGGLNLKYVLLGVLTALILAFVLSGIVGAVMYQGWLSEIHSPLVMTAVSFLSLFLGGVYAGRRAGRAGWAHGALAGLFYLVLVSILGLLLFDQLAPVMVLLQRLIVGAALGAVGGTVGINIRG